MEQKRLFVGTGQGIDELLVFAGPQRRHGEGLSFAAGEQRRAVGAWQHSDLGNDRPHRPHVTPVDAPLGVEDVPAHDLGFQFLEEAGNLLL